MSVRERNNRNNNHPPEVNLHAVVNMSWHELHHTSTVVDLHTHPALKSIILDISLSSSKRDLLSKMFDKGFWPLSNRVTFPKMDKGGVDVILSTAYILEQQWIKDISLIRYLFKIFRGVRRKLVDPSYFDATIYMLDEMEHQIISYNDNPKHTRKVRLANSVTELNNGIEAGDMCVVHSVEGAHSLNGTPEGKTLEDPNLPPEKEITEALLHNLEHLFNRGVAYLTLAHFYPNHVAYPVFPYPEYSSKMLDWRKATGRWDMNKGLTTIGEAVVEKMLDLGMLIDLTHCTPKARSRVMEIARHHRKKDCIMASHMASFDIQRDPINLSDKEIKWIGNAGGVIGVILMSYYLSSSNSGLGLKHVENNINHMINVGGIDVVGIGSDLDGFTDPPDEIVDMSEMPRLTSYLLALGYTDKQIQSILGGNALRVLRESWGKQ